MVKCPDCGCLWDKATKSRSNRCNPCRRTWEVAWRERRKAEGRPVQSTKMPREYHRAYEEAYFSEPENRERRNANMRKYARGPKRGHHEARWQVRRAIVAGRLERRACEVCGTASVHAHHDDYSRPLDVRWLCPAHHAEVHAKAEGRE